MNEPAKVQLSFPASPELIALARFAAATVAVRAGFDVEEIEDLRLAVDELCIALRLTGAGALDVEMDVAEGEVRVKCTLRPDGAAPARPAPPDLDYSAQLSEQILAALVDEHGVGTSDGQPCAWLLKRSGR